MAATIIKTLTQIGLGVGAVYVTVQQGVWGSNNQGVEAFEKVKRSVLPAANSYLQEIPSISDVRSTILKKWNSGVKTVFTGVENTPVYVKKAYDKAVGAVDKK